MKVMCDTAILVELDRCNEGVIHLMETLTWKNVELAISTITVSEILTGVYLQKEPNKHLTTAKELLSQFKWYNLDAEAAEETSKILAKRIQQGNPVEYQDYAIAATFKTAKADFLLTMNEKHFNLSFLEGKIFNPKKFARLIKENKLKFRI
jgi:predicted nucleic acid-binding protein